MTSTLQSHGPLLQEDSAIMGVLALQRGSCVSVRIDRPSNSPPRHLMCINYHLVPCGQCHSLET